MGVKVLELTPTNTALGTWNLIIEPPVAIPGTTPYRMTVADFMSVFGLGGGGFYFEDTLANIQAAAIAGNLVKGATYKVLDSQVDSTYAYDVKVTLKAATPYTFEPNAVGEFLNPDCQGVGDYSGVVAITGIAAGVQRGPWNYDNVDNAIYQLGDFITWGNRNWQIVDIATDYFALLNMPPDTNPAFAELLRTDANVGYITQKETLLGYDIVTDEYKFRRDETRNFQINWDNKNNVDFGNDLLKDLKVTSLSATLSLIGSWSRVYGTVSDQAVVNLDGSGGIFNVNASGSGQITLGNSRIRAKVTVTEFGQINAFLLDNDGSGDFISDHLLTATGFSSIYTGAGQASSFTLIATDESNIDLSDQVGNQSLTARRVWIIAKGISNVIGIPNNNYTTGNYINIRAYDNAAIRMNLVDAIAECYVVARDIANVDISNAGAGSDIQILATGGNIVSAVALAGFLRASANGIANQITADGLTGVAQLITNSNGCVLDVTGADGDHDITANAPNFTYDGTAAIAGDSCVGVSSVSSTTQTIVGGGGAQDFAQ